ncbi:hypothetical protein G6F64_014680 [Rhizopus arrhizus]|uniref:Uncharacterized protein n=1 Tax=Rhizopus oryzae TaxID=64495 RepID=A0A9P6WT13_RHIOR|nr:hypothetical protein G6F64_014680 [Rhizopus arrhizus]
MPPGWPVPHTLMRSSASAPRTSPTTTRSGRRRMDERTSSVMDTTPARHAVASGGDLGQKRVRQRGLAGAGAAGDQDVLPLAHGAAQELGLPGGQDAVGHVAIQADDAHGPLA